MAQSESMIHESMELTRRRMENPIRVLRAGGQADAGTSARPI
jgi:hypothetical protein